VEADIKKSVFTILIADPQLSFEGVVTELAENEGVLVLRTVTAAETLSKTREFQPDSILLSCALDHGLGMEILPDLLLADPKAGVIMITHWPEAAEAVEAMKQGATDYLEIPLDQRKLREALANQMELFGVRFRRFSASLNRCWAPWEAPAK